ncbi:MAG: zf-HC2 domain-containing protein [Candidatus Eisenbacteria bacterium]
MTICNDEARKLDYLDGVLSAEERASFERHLRECPACRGEIEGLAAAVRAVRALPREGVPADLARSVRGAMPTAESESVILRGRRARWGYGRIAAGVAAASALLASAAALGGLPGGAMHHPAVAGALAVALVLIPTLVESVHALFFLKLPAAEKGWRPPDRLA